MSDTVIRVKNLSKKYIIGHQKQERYTALRDVITNKVKSLGSLINSQAKKENSTFEEFWALKDVFFEIKQGDRVGIIGRNGAGKSTLLKILSRITEPTTGSIKIKGRVASLLEVGTGFHPELTGRENIFLNGAILGMSKGEIKRKFDEIVAFAEVEKFLDTPVKRYSSGMYVRLAFAVAAHLEPEILIVDEVLAVGDAQFQKKCLGKMEDVAEKEGRTVLFVSHNMAAVKNLCNHAMLLNNGHLKSVGSTLTIIDQYYDSFLQKSANIFIPKVNSICYIQDIYVGDKNALKAEFTTDEAIVININIYVDNVNSNTDFRLFINSHKLGIRLCLIEENLQHLRSKSKQNNIVLLTIKIPANFLMPGAYICELGLLYNLIEYLDYHSEVGYFEVIQGSNSFLKYVNLNRDLGLVFSQQHQIVIH